MQCLAPVGRRTWTHCRPIGSTRYSRPDPAEPSGLPRSPGRRRSPPGWSGLDSAGKARVSWDGLSSTGCSRRQPAPPQSSARHEHWSLWSSSILLRGLRYRVADVDAKRARHLNRAGTHLLGNLVILGDRREDLGGLGRLALLDQGHGGHLAGASEPRAVGLGERIEARDHLLRLERVEFERGLADQREIAERLRQTLVSRNLLELGDRQLGIVLLDGDRGAAEQRRGTNALAVILRQHVEPRRRGSDLALAERGIDLRELIDGLFGLTAAIIL